MRAGFEGKSDEFLNSKKGGKDDAGAADAGADKKKSKKQKQK